MVPKIKRKWIKALRSGRYKQGQEFLLKDNRYCCLGVLCKVLRKDIAQSKPKNGEETLSGELLKLTGLTSEQQNKLADMNDSITRDDGRNTSFKEIADYIEENL